MANGAAPSYPWEVVDSDTGAISSQLQKKRDLFGGYVIANYCPYDVDQPPSNPLNGVVYSFDWIGFNDYLNYLYQSDSYIDKGRLLEIIFLADSTGVNPLSGGDSQRQLVNDYRHQNSDNLKDESKMNPFGYQSKAFKFDEGSVGDKAEKFSDQFGGSVSEVAEGLSIFQPRTNPMTTIPGTPGRPGRLLGGSHVT